MSDRLSVGQLREYAGPWWRDFFINDSTESTNTDAARAADRLVGEGYVFLTEHQRKGRGRLDRQWETPAGEAVTMSLVLRPSSEIVQWPWLSMLAAVAVKTTIDQWVGDVWLKWPNDVMVGEKKIAGILSEIIGDAVVVGIGLNVNQRDLAIPTATSLWAQRGQEFDRTTIAGSILKVFAEHYQQWLVDPNPLREQYRHHCGTVGQEVELVANGKIYRGIASAVDDSGQLVINNEPFSIGDVVHVRTTGVGN